MRIHMTLCLVVGLAVVFIACEKKSDTYDTYRTPRHQLEIRADESIFEGQAAMPFYDRQVRVANKEGVDDPYSERQFARGDSCVLPRGSHVSSEVSEFGFVLGRLDLVFSGTETDETCLDGTLFLVTEDEFRPWINNLRYFFAGYKDEFGGSGERYLEGDPDAGQWSAIVEQFTPYVRDR